MVMTALTPSCCAANATPCAWLPAEAVMTPAVFSAGDSWLILL